MNKSWFESIFNPQLRLFGTDLVFHWSWFFLVAVSLYNNTFMSIWLPVTILVIMHEFGHIIAAKLCGLETSRIWVTPLGGLAEYRNAHHNPTHEFIVTLGGPLVNLVLVPVTYWIDDTNFIFIINMSMLIFNVLPIFPLDGGVILRSIIWKITNQYYNATWWSVRVGQILAVILFVSGVLMSQFLICLILGILLYASEEYLKMAKIQSELKIVKEQLSRADISRRVTEFSRRIY